MATLTRLVMAAMGVIQTMVILGMVVTEVEVADLIVADPGVLGVLGHPVTLAQQALMELGLQAATPGTLAQTAMQVPQVMPTLGTLVTQVHPETLGVLVPQAIQPIKNKE